jgi:hypothetical protein
MNTFTFGTDAMIEEMIETNAGLSAKQQFLLGESLRSLVRLAKSEQLREIKANVRKLTGSGFQIISRTKASKEMASSGQQSMHFNDLDD